MFERLFGVGNLDGAEFTKLVAKVGVELGRFTNPQVDPAHMRILDGRLTVNLRNFYPNFLLAPKRSRMRYIREHVLAEMQVPEGTWAEMARSILPVLRSDSYLGCADLEVKLSMGVEASVNITYKQLAPGLFVTLVVDTESHMMHVTSRQLEEWGVTFAEAYEVAMRNLVEVSPELPLMEMDGMWILDGPDVYSAARLLLVDMWQELCENPLVAVPNRGVLLVADPKNQSAVEKMMLLMSGDPENEQYPISVRIYQLVNGSVEAWVPTQASVVATAYQARVTLETAAAYEREREMRRRLDENAFYASLQVAETTDGLFSFTTWAKGVATKLPEADRVIFVDLDENPDDPAAWDVPWDTVVNAGLVVQTDSPLTRWQTGEFPSSTWLAQHARRSRMN